MLNQNEKWEELKEKLADIEHQRWADWQNYVHDKLDYSTGKYVLRDEDVEHWNLQIHTPYCNLSDKEKDSDREQVDRYLPLLKNFILSQRKQDREAIRELVKNFIEKSKKYPICYYPESETRADVYNKGHNKALTDLLSFLDGLEGGE